MAEKRTKNKGGRPALGEEKRDLVVSVYLSVAEHRKASKKAEAAGMRLGEYARAVTLAGYVKAIDTPEAQVEKRKLIGLSNNVNQLAKVAHIQGMKAMVTRLDELLDEIDGIIKKYKR